MSRRHPRAADTRRACAADRARAEARRRRSPVSRPCFGCRLRVRGDARPTVPNLEAQYRALVEQIPAVVFMAYLDEGIGEAYVSPQIEAALGFSQQEWLEDPVRWYQQIHPDDKERWSIEAAEMFLTGKPLRSAYRVHRARRTRHLVPLRGGDDPARRWPALVHPWRRLRHHRAQARRAGAAGGTQSPVGDPRHGGRAGRRARSAAAASCVSTARASGSAGYDVEAGARALFVSGAVRRARRGARASETHRSSRCAHGPSAGRLRERMLGHAATASRRLIAWSGTVAAAPPDGAGIHHRDRHRRHRAQAAGARDARDQRPRAAPDRAGSARRARPASDRHRVHEQGAAAAARGAARCPKRPRRAQDRAAGQRGDRQDARARHAGCCRWCRTPTA